MGKVKDRNNLFTFTWGKPGSRDCSVIYAPNIKEAKRLLREEMSVKRLPNTLSWGGLEVS